MGMMDSASPLFFLQNIIHYKKQKVEAFYVDQLMHFAN